MLKIYTRDLLIFSGGDILRSKNCQNVLAILGKFRLKKARLCIRHAYFYLKYLEHGYIPLGSGISSGGALSSGGGSKKTPY